MSYVAQIMCYACNATMGIVYKQQRPSDSEVETYQISGWDAAGWLSPVRNWEHWAGFCASRIYDGDTNLAKTWVIGPKSTLVALDPDGQPVPGGTCTIDGSGEKPKLVGSEGVSSCRVDNATSVCAELWRYLRTGERGNLCEGCP